MDPEIGGMDGSPESENRTFSGCVTPRGRKYPFLSIFRDFWTQNPGKMPLGMPEVLKMARNGHFDTFWPPLPGSRVFYRGFRAKIAENRQKSGILRSQRRQNRENEDF